MTKQDKEPQNLQIRKIRRKQVYLSLAIAAGLGFLVYRCVDSENEEIANEPIDALFYQNTAQCEADIQIEQDVYELEYKDALFLPLHLIVKCIGQFVK